MSLTSLRSSHTLTNAALAGSLAALLVVVGPPGTDFAAHVFQLNVYLKHGLRALDELLVRGPVHVRRLQPPLLPARGARRDQAARGAERRRLRGRVHARDPRRPGASRPSGRRGSSPSSRRPRSSPRRSPTASGSRSRSTRSSRSPAGASSLFAILAALTLAASPLAFLFLLVVLARRRRLARRGARSSKPARDRAARSARVGAARLAALPRPRPLPVRDRRAARGARSSARLGAALTWRVERARILRALFVAYGVVCVLAYLIPSNLGENVVRLRYAAMPLAVLTLSLRRWRPLPVADRSPSRSRSRGTSRRSPAASRAAPTTRRRTRAYWQPVVALPAPLALARPTASRPSARPTTGRPSTSPQAGIPIVRGWFRQDDFPQNEVLYDKLTRARRT